MAPSLLWGVKFQIQLLLMTFPLWHPVMSLEVALKNFGLCPSELAPSAFALDLKM